jgi:hypothetical protein
MTVYVFMGPTLSVEEARVELDAVYLPPVSQGDVYRVGLLRPEAIGIIDGYFDQVPAVWHKEILWAMTQGIHVYGSASIGALRAAELAPFGMEGVGLIFEAYRDGLLEDDDEVAVAHGLVETGYRCLSVAMVNIRRTLAQAEAEDIVTPPTRSTLERIAKNLFYPDRSYVCILRQAAAQGLPAAELHAFGNWLPRGQINQKRQDALAMLGRMREQLGPNLEPKSVTYRLEHTVFWDDLTLLAGGAGPQVAKELTMLTTDAIFEELRLRGAAYLDACERGRLRELALREAQHQGYRADHETVEKKAAELRQIHGLNLPEDLEHWLQENHLSRYGLDELIQEEAVVARVLAERDRGHRWAQDHLRVSGEFRELRARALDKQRRLEAAGQQNPTFEGAGVTREALLQWYFRRLGPFFAPDPQHYTRKLGFEHVEAFLIAVLREYCYVGLKESDMQRENDRFSVEMT